MADTNPTATNANTDTAATTPAKDATVADRAHAASDTAKELFAQAQAKVSEALSTAVGAAKENPKTAAAIAAGAAATVAGAAYGVSKLRESDTTAADAKKTSPKKK